MGVRVTGEVCSVVRLSNHVSVGSDLGTVISLYGFSAGWEMIRTKKAT